MLYKSSHPDLNIPTHLTTWQWAFESPEHSPVLQHSPHAHGYYENACTKERLYYSEVKSHATNLCAALVRQYGFGVGDTVSLFAGNGVWYAVALWAAVRAGGRVNGASPAYNVEEMSHALRVARTKFLFTLPGALDVAVAAAENVGLSKDRIFLLEGRREGFASLHELIELGKKCDATESYSIPPGSTNKEICGYLNFSSGTTGLPKAVMLSHHNLIAQCHQLRQLQVLDPGEGYRILAVTPLFHITGLVRYIHYPLLMNGNSIMLPSFTMESMLQAITTYRIPELILVPPILIRIVRDPIVDAYLPALRATVKRFSSGSAPIAPEIISLLQRRFPGTGFRQGYGATESTACISCHPPSHYDYKYATTGGKLVANTQAIVVALAGSENDDHADDNAHGDPGKGKVKRLLGPRQTGEICARGPQIAMGYLENERATRETFDEEGFFHTGDVGFIDDEGLIHIEDRIKEMIKVRGQQVAPSQLEDVLQGHDAVQDCAVLGIADDYSGEKPKAYVLVKRGITPTRELGLELLSFVQARCIRYKWLLEIEFAESIPKSSTGKLLRRILKANDRVSDRVRGLVVREEKARM